MGLISFVLRVITKIKSLGTPTIPSPLTNYDIRLKIKRYIQQGTPVAITQVGSHPLSDVYLIRVVGEENWKSDGSSFLFGHLFNRVTRKISPFYISEYTVFTAQAVITGVSAFDYKVFLELADILQFTNQNDYNEEGIILKPEYYVNRYLKLINRTTVKLGVVSNNGNIEKIRFYSLPYFQTMDVNYRERQTLYYGIDQVPMNYEQLWKAWTYYRHYRYVQSNTQPA